MNLTTVNQPEYGDGATLYASTQTTWMENNEGVVQGIQDRYELGSNLLIGVGVIAGSYSGNLLSAGAGLSVNVAAFSALIGIPIQKTTTSIAGGLTPSATNYIYLKQDGSYEDNTTGVSPGTTANPAILLGTATTDGSGVTAVDNTRVEIVTLGRGQREETFGPQESGSHLKAWGTDRDGTGAASAVYAITLDAEPIAGTLVEVYRGTGEDVRLAKTITWTISGDEITLLAPYRPFDDGTIRERIRVVYCPAP